MSKILDTAFTGTVFLGILTFFLASYCLVSLRYLLSSTSKALPANPYADIPLPKVASKKKKVKETV